MRRMQRHRDRSHVRKENAVITDTFKPRELIDIAVLAGHVQRFNKEQHGTKPIWAEVVLYRDGKKVAELTEAHGDPSDHERGDLVFDPQPEEDA